MRNFFDSLGNFTIKALIVGYLVMAFFVGIRIMRDNGESMVGGAPTAILRGAAWPITLLIELVQKR